MCLIDRLFWEMLFLYKGEQYDNDVFRFGKSLLPSASLYYATE